MQKCLVILIALACFADAGSVALNEYMTLEWDFLEDDSINFELTLTQAFYQQTGYCYVGFNDEEDYYGGDYVLELKNVETKDCYGVDEDEIIPNSDVSMGGTNDIVDSINYVEDVDYLYITWNRVPVTGDEYDEDLIEGQDYYVYWGYGDIDEFGKPVDPTDDGHVQITLSGDYSGTSSTSFLNFAR